MFALAALAGCGRIGFDALGGGGGGGDDTMQLDSGSGSGSSDAALPSDASGAAGTFGTMEVGISTQNTGADRIWISSFALTESALVHTLVVHVGPTGGKSTTLRGVIYADAGGTPTTLLGTTDQVALSGSAARGWLALPLASPLSLAPGTYWLGTHNATQLGIEYRSATGCTRFTSDLYGDGASSPYAGGATTYTMQLSIYAEYTH